MVASRCAAKSAAEPSGGSVCISRTRRSKRTVPRLGASGDSLHQSLFRCRHQTRRRDGGFDYEAEMAATSTRSRGTSSSRATRRTLNRSRSRGRARSSQVRHARFFFCLMASRRVDWLVGGHLDSKSRFQRAYASSTPERRNSPFYLMDGVGLDWLFDRPPPLEVAAAA